MQTFPAIGLIECSSIARGMTITDAVVKKAEVRLLQANPISPGRYLLLFWGPVAEVEESLKDGLAICGDRLVASLFLPGVDQQVLDCLRKQNQRPEPDSLGILETFDVSSALLSADAACKAAEVRLIELRLAHGIGGKGYWVLSGELFEIQAAMEAAVQVAGDKLAQQETIARPHPDMLNFLW
jgi:microcompartment protein CcmL/EutN